MSFQKNQFLGAYLHVNTKSTLYDLVGEKMVDVLSEVNTEFWETQPNGLLLIGNMSSDGTSWHIDHDGGLINLNLNHHVIEHQIKQFESFYAEIINVITEKVGEENLSIGFGYMFYHS
jgi:hypothetical protein